MPTIGSLLDKHQGHGPGFNTIRVVLAIGVMLDHSVELTSLLGGDVVRSWPLLWVRMFIVPAFFALSGFLVAGSMLRLKSVKAFVVFRGLRILPALATEVVLSAIVLGPLITQLSISEYFTSDLFRSYFLNMVGYIHYELPGVFTDPTRNHTRIVNGSLWTVPSEIYCYITLTMLIILRLAYKRSVMALLTGIAMLIVIALCIALKKPPVGVAHWTTIILCFYAGAVVYLFRHAIPVHPSLIIVALFAFISCVYWVPSVSAVLGPLSATYLICCAGMLPLPDRPLYFAGDYSYGIYLYGFPFQQLVVWWTHYHSPWYQNLAVSLPLAICMAIFSWHIVERPALSLRKHFVGSQRNKKTTELSVIGFGRIKGVS